MKSNFIIYFTGFYGFPWLRTQAWVGVEGVHIDTLFEASVKGIVTCL